MTFQSTAGNDDTREDARDRYLNDQAKLASDHFIVMVCRDEGEDGLEPIAFCDGLFESEEYAQDPGVLAQELSNLVVRFDGTPEGDELAHAVANGKLRYRVGAVRFTSEGTP